MSFWEMWRCSGTTDLDMNGQMEHDIVDEDDDKEFAVWILTMNASISASESKDLPSMLYYLLLFLFIYYEKI
jgi:hypothetical protein